MKKILLIILGVLVVDGLVIFYVVKQQSGYTKVLTAKLVRQDLATGVSGTGQIKPRTYVNVAANMRGRGTHFYWKDGDSVKTSKTGARNGNIQRRGSIAGQDA